MSTPKEKSVTPKITPVQSFKLFGWRLHAVMADRGIQSATDLKAQLEAIGLPLSMSTVSRMVYKEPMQLDLRLLAGLCAILKCTPNDLLFKTTN